MYLYTHFSHRFFRRIERDNGTVNYSNVTICIDIILQHGKQPFLIKTRSHVIDWMVVGGVESDMV